MRAWLTRCTVLTTLALIACGTVAPTPTPTLPPIPTPRPTATLTSLQATADMVRRNQQVQRGLNAQATMTTACDRLRPFYAEKGQPFDPTLAATDPQRMLIELRIMHWGNGDPPRGMAGSSVDDAWWEYIKRCGGR